LARIFANAGHPVLSADEFAREITAPGSAGLAQIAAAFGEVVLLPDGSFNRSGMRALIAKDSGARLKLESITHPLIQARSLAAAQELFARGAGLVFYEAPLLFEAKSDHKMDKVICVTAPEELRLKRVMDRDGRGLEEARALMASQIPQEEKAARSDFVIENAGSEAELSLRARDLLKKLRA
jgi:dephospho-CoA kinase